MSTDIKLAPVVGGALLIAVVLSIWIFIGPKDTEEDVKAAYLPGGEFPLSHGGEPFHMESLRGQPYILYFGFTHCPDVCPLGLAVIRDTLQQDPALSEVKALFVSIDPARDTAGHVQEYAAFFHPNILGRTGTLAEIQALAKAYGTYFMAGEKDASGNYNVDHTAYFYLIDSEGELRRVLDHNASPAFISEALRKLL